MQILRDGTQTQVRERHFLMQFVARIIIISIPCYTNRQLSHRSQIKPPKQLLITTSWVFLEILRSRHKISSFPPTTLTWTFNKRWYLQTYKTPKHVRTILWCVSDQQSVLYQHNSLFVRFSFCIQWHCVNFHRFHIHHKQTTFVLCYSNEFCFMFSCRRLHRGSFKMTVCFKEADHPYSTLLEQHDEYPRVCTKWI